VNAGWWGPEEYHPVYHPSTKPVYRKGYHPAYQQKASSVPIVKSPNDVRRTSGVTRSATLYDNRSTGVRRPVAIVTPRTSGEITRTTPRAPRQSDTRPINRPVTPPVPQPEPQPIPRDETPREPGTRPITRPVTPPVQQPKPQPVLMPETQRIVTRPSAREDNVYAAPNGNIMRSTPQGWQQRDQNTWKKADETTAKQEIVRDSEVRQRAAERLSIPRTPPPAPDRNSDDKGRKR